MTKTRGCAVCGLARSSWPMTFKGGNFCGILCEKAGLEGPSLVEDERIPPGTALAGSAETTLLCPGCEEEVRPTAGSVLYKGQVWHEECAAAAGGHA